jgi:hypothetical protein
MRPTLALLDLLDQVRDLMRVELSLLRAEISERASGIPSSLTAVVVGIVLLPSPSGLSWLRPACSFCVSEFPSIWVSNCRRGYDRGEFTPAALGRAGLKPSRLVPAKSISQISSLFGGL